MEWRRIAMSETDILHGPDDTEMFGVNITAEGQVERSKRIVLI
jgi:hypothetical protein